MAAGLGNQGPVVVVVVVVVLVLVVVEGDVLEGVVFGAVEDGALVCGRLGSGGEVGLGAALDHAVVAETRVAPLATASVWLPPAVARPTLDSVVVEPTVPTRESIVSGSVATVGKVVLVEMRSAPVSSSFTS